MRRFCLVSSDTVGMKQSSGTDVGFVDMSDGLFNDDDDDDDDDNNNNNNDDDDDVNDDYDDNDNSSSSSSTPSFRK